MSVIDVKDEKKTPEKNNTTYEDDLDELTRLVDQIGEEDCPVDQLESKVRRAADLIRSLRERLAATETTVREVLGDLEVEDREGQ